MVKSSGVRNSGKYRSTSSMTRRVTSSSTRALIRLIDGHRDKVLTHRQVLRELWGPKAEAQTHYLRTYMLRLRRKLEDDLDAPKYFQTESGIGYRFLSESAEAG